MFYQKSPAFCQQSPASTYIYHASITTVLHSLNRHSHELYIHESWTLRTQVTICAASIMTVLHSFNRALYLIKRENTLAHTHTHTQTRMHTHTHIQTHPPHSLQLRSSRLCIQRLCPEDERPPAPPPSLPTAFSFPISTVCVCVFLCVCVCVCERFLVSYQPCVCVSLSLSVCLSLVPCPILFICVQMLVCVCLSRSCVISTFSRSPVCAPSICARIYVCMCVCLYMSAQISSCASVHTTWIVCRMPPALYMSKRCTDISLCIHVSIFL